MKKTVVFILLSTIFILSFGQTKILTSEEKTQKQVRENALLNLEINYIIDKWGFYQNGSEKPMGYIEAIEYMEKSLADLSGDKIELDFKKKNKEQINTLFSSLKFIGNDYAKYASDVNPVSILFKDEGRIFFIQSIFIDDIFNTVKLSARQRAAKVISTYLINCLKESSSIISDKSISFFASGAAYGCKDLLEDNSSIEGEYVYIISSRIMIEKYSLGFISEEDLVNQSSIFLREKDNFSLKKVKISLE
jgi:hypothetical protein